MSMTIEDCAVPREPKAVPSTSENVMEQFSMKGKVVAITGAADGIGLAVAEAIAEAGGDVVMLYNTNNAADKHAQRLTDAHNVRAIALQCDVSQSDQVQHAIEQIVKNFGHLDVFVANAGMSISKPILEQTEEEYHRQMDVNIGGVFLCAKYAGKVFKQQGKGNFIITGSISAHVAVVPVDQPVYNATKAAVTHMGKSLAREWRDFARVNIVSPGYFDTAMGASPRCITEVHRMTVLGRQGHVKEIKALYLYLASDASSYQTGSDTVIDGGYTIV